MNEKIKQILEKHLEYKITDNLEDIKNLTSAIIEICEEQKRECASKYEYPYSQFILNAKNIAE